MIRENLQSGTRQLHTIISRELIKPSSPTPSHVQIYNLSRIDQFMMPHLYLPLILLYRNNENISFSLSPNEKARVMKNALSHSLTQWYPFAGRFHTSTTPYVDCNDEGVLFVEAKHDTQLDKFQNMSEEDESVGQLFADSMVWHNSVDTSIVVGIQLNHFECGGFAVAVSMSHSIGDASTVCSFVNYWALVARYGSTNHKDVQPLNPHFVQSLGAPNFVPPEVSFLNLSYPNRTTRKFVFSNSKLSDLKNKVLAQVKDPRLALPINNPTRFEVLTSLLYKTLTTPRSSSFKPSFLVCPMDIRKNLIPELPQTTVGNVIAFLLLTTKHAASDTSLNAVVSEIRKQKMQFEGVQSLQLAFQSFERLVDKDEESDASRTFWCSSMCRLPFYEVDFGWGKPIAARVTLESSHYTGYMLMDTPKGDGIEAFVTLERQDMETFQNDEEILLFCNN